MSVWLLFEGKFPGSIQCSFISEIGAEDKSSFRVIVGLCSLTVWLKLETYCCKYLAT